MEDIKVIIQYNEKPKTIKEKEKQKRKITKTNKWNFTEEELNFENHYNILQVFCKNSSLNDPHINNDVVSDDSTFKIYNDTNDSSKTKFIYQQIKNKLSSYRSQDIEKGKYDLEKFADLSHVLYKMDECKMKCFYCKESVSLLYENVREPKQWTLERIDNKMGHNNDNVEIACLSCNLRRRTIHYERYILTKNIQKIVKM